jgi:hypothetical protein
MMSVGTWTRLSAVARCTAARTPGTGNAGSHEPSRSLVDDDWQCGQFMVALLISQNGPENLSPASALGKLPRDLTEPLEPFASAGKYDDGERR